MRRMLRHPVLHFLLIGSLFFSANTWLGSVSSSAALHPIAFSVDRVSALRGRWIALMGRRPTEREFSAAIEQAVNDEILFREALALGLNHSDPIVRHRLIRNMRFLNEDWTRADDDILAEALSLGLDRSDIVVRRRLIQKMASIISEATDQPREHQVDRFLTARDRHPVEPARVRLSHLYLARDAHGDRLEEDALRLLQKLGHASILPENAVALGDPFLLRHHLLPLSESELTRIFGAAFARAVMGLAPGVWSGPVGSSYGLHLVWIHERSEARPAPLAAARKLPATEMRTAAERNRLRKALAQLRTRYTVSLPAGSDI